MTAPLPCGPTPDDARPRGSFPRGICPACLTDRAVVSHGIQHHDVPGTGRQRPRCAGSGQQPLAGGLSAARDAAIAAAERQRNVGFDAALRRCEAAVAQARRFYDAALMATEATYRAELARIERDHGDPARVALRRPDAETRDRTEENR